MCVFSLLLFHVHSHRSSLWEASTPIPFVDILGAHFGHSYEPDPEPRQQLCRLRSSYFGWLMVRSCASENLVSLLHFELLKIFKYCIVVRSVVRWIPKSCATCHVCPEAHHTCNFDFGASQHPSLGDMKCEFLKASQSLESHAYSDYTFSSKRWQFKTLPWLTRPASAKGSIKHMWHSYRSYEIHFDPTVLSWSMPSNTAKNHKESVKISRRADKTVPNCWSMLQEDCGQHGHSRPRRCLPGSFPFTVRTKGKRPGLSPECCIRVISEVWEVDCILYVQITSKLLFNRLSRKINI